MTMDYECNAEFIYHSDKTGEHSVVNGKFFRE